MMHTRPFLCMLTATALMRAALAENVPVVLGVDDAGSYHHSVVGKDAWTFAAYFKALDELGAKYISIHFFPTTDAGQQNARLTGERVAGLDRAMREHGMRYSLNVELSNFAPRLEITPGVNELDRPGGVHRWDLRMEWLDPFLPPTRPGRPALATVLYDECEHMILSNNKFSNSPKNTFDEPCLVNTHGLPLTTAYDRLVAEASRLAKEHYRDRIPLQSEQVWPDLFHIFARAGWIITPKLLKESINPVVMSVALGAAIEYQDRGARLWASPDLWNWDLYPGHSPQAMTSALMIGYWLGAETVYVENLDFHRWPNRHPQAGPEGSLIRWTSADQYETTPHGKAYREFCKQYVPNHPRSIRWQDYDPRVAIIRLPDGAWGQFTPKEGELASRNRLLGNREMPADAISNEWLDVWPFLTHGAVRAGAICGNNRAIYPKGIENVIVPIDSVAVFDHLVRASALAHVECLIVCGHALPADTFAAIRDRVAGGATCVIARRLYNLHATGELPGRWLIVDDFKDPRVASRLQPFLGPPDVARFRFKRQVVEFRRGEQPDAITVKVSNRP